VRRGAAGRGESALLVLALLLGAGCAGSGGPDPWQGANRRIFAFNEGVDRFVLEPVATGWDFVLPELAQRGIRNFFGNLDMPVVFLNDLLQAKPVAAGQDLARFLVNSTLGLAGFVDVASRLRIPENDEDFGQTLGSWGTPSGPYVVLPLLGPSTVRDALSRPIDGLTAPWWYFVPLFVTVSVTGVEIVNLRAFYLEEIRESRELAFDYYVFVRDAYLQNRERRVRDARPRGDEERDDLYFPDDEDDLYFPDASGL
jgi:phospholipid-binding lipoprotein MlaA